MEPGLSSIPFGNRNHPTVWHILYPTTLNQWSSPPPYPLVVARRLSQQPETSQVGLTFNTFTSEMPHQTIIIARRERWGLHFFMRSMAKTFGHHAKNWIDQG